MYSAKDVAFQHNRYNGCATIPGVWQEVHTTIIFTFFIVGMDMNRMQTFQGYRVNLVNSIGSAAWEIEIRVD